MENDANERKVNTFEVPIEGLFPKFEEHLEIENNRRILFSGKFGIGKTYFLNEFFKSKKDKYECYHLFPVNYQISSNEDIIEFIKYDIIIELIKKDEHIFVEKDYNNFLDLQRLLFIWGKNNVQKIFDTGISLIPKLGRPLEEIIKLVRGFLKFKNQVEKGDIENFLDEISKKKITETEFLSEIIKEKVKAQKETKEETKESVLILDDIDRIDPEQIFRLLNVFSAHLDLQNKELPNKFGFDKIIIVADFPNLQSIFHHKYGQHTDSSGYFSKFFSVEIFQFKNEEIIAEVVDKVISEFSIGDVKWSKDAIKDSGGHIRHILKDIIERALELTGEEKLNMWQLLKGVKFSLPAFKSESYPNLTISKYIKISIRTLVSIFNGLDSNLISVLKKIKGNLGNKETTKQIFLYKLYSFHLLKEIKNFEKDIASEGKILWKQYEIKINLGEQKIDSVSSKEDDSLPLASAELFYDLLIEHVNQGLHNKKVGIF